MSQRGKIDNRALATQVRDFTGLRFGSITPTDIDALIDFQDRVYVLIETKLGNKAMPNGQRLAIQRLVDIIASSGRVAIALVARHNNAEGDIDFASCEIAEYRFRGKWITPRTKLTVREAIDIVLKRFT